MYLIHFKNVLKKYILAIQFFQKLFNNNQKLTNMAKKTFAPIDSGTLEGLAKILGHTDRGLSGTELSKFIPEAGLIDLDASNTKWKRLYNSFADFQNRTNTSNHILRFIIGLQLNESGIFNPVEISKTISEAEIRVNRFKSKLTYRNIHPKIYEYCNSELIAENYFHSVFEAVKSIAE